jgi:hypothetical protein
MYPWNKTHVLYKSNRGNKDVLTCIFLALGLGMDTKRLLTMLLSQDTVLLLDPIRWLGIRLEQRRTAAGLALALQTDKHAQSDGDGQSKQPEVDEEANCHDVALKRGRMRKTRRLLVVYNSGKKPKGRGVKEKRRTSFWRKDDSLILCIFAQACISFF